jgi:hypothetical protein
MEALAESCPPNETVLGDVNIGVQQGLVLRSTTGVAEPLARVERQEFDLDTRVSQSARQRQVAPIGREL